MSIPSTSFVSPKFLHTTVSPIFAEEWHVRPPAYDIYDNYPDYCEDVPINKILDPRDFPYGQYLTRVNLLPSDERKVALYNTCKYFYKEPSPIGYINSKFVIDDITFRDNMTRINKKLLARRFRHNCNDTFSPYNSF